MSVDLVMTLDPSGSVLIPANRASFEAMEELQDLGGEFVVKVTQVRNLGFHKKGFALFRFLFNLWEPRLDVAPGVPVKKHFDAFRGNLTIAAGFYTQVFNLEGGFELIPESLNFATMDNVRFAKVFNALLDVGLQMIGKADHITHEQAEHAIEHLLGFV